MRPHSRASLGATRRRLHPVIVAAVIVMLLGAFTFGYRSGVTKRYRRYLTSLNEADNATAVQLTDCRRRRSEQLELAAKGDSELQAKVTQLKQLSTRLDALGEENNRLVTRIERCEDNVEKYTERANDPTTEDAQRLAEVTDVQKRVAALLAKFEAATGGMSEKLYTDLRARSLGRRRYIDTCNRVPGCFVESNEDLLGRYVRITPSMGIEQEIEKVERVEVAYLPPPMTRDSSDIGDIYMPDFANGRDNLRVFNRDVNALYRTSRLNEGGVALSSSEGISVASFTERLSYLQNIALCAYRKNDSSLSIPSAFRCMSAGMTAGDVAQLDELITTPLVMFCGNCQADASFIAQHLTCIEHRVSLHYGGHDFWAVRSRILPSPATNKTASDYYAAQDLTRKRTLAVVLWPPSKKECNLAARARRSLHYLYLRHAFPNDVSLSLSASDSSHHRCAPTPVKIVGYIELIVSRQAAPYEAIYLSMRQDLRESVMSVLGNGAHEALRRRVHFYKPMESRRPAEETIVDLEIASRASAIIVGAYDLVSGYVAERFLLRSGMDPGGRVYFF